MTDNDDFYLNNLDDEEEEEDEEDNDYDDDDDEIYADDDDDDKMDHQPSKPSTQSSTTSTNRDINNPQQRKLGSHSTSMSSNVASAQTPTTVAGSSVVTSPSNTAISPAGLSTSLPVNASSSKSGAGTKGSNRSDGEDEFKYEVLTPDKIVQYMIECIKDVNQVLELTPTTTRILLHHFRWDKEKLMERFYDGDQDRLFAEAHIVNPFKAYQKKVNNPSSQSLPASSSQSNQLSKLPSKSKEYCCEICYFSNPEENMTGLECGHRFCKICWKEYLKTKIIDDGMGQTISCAAHKCDILVDDNTVMSLIDEPNIRLKYQHLITNSFVECNRLMRWCPAPNCSNAVRAQYFDAQRVRCLCGHVFCFGCGELWHDPVKCKWLKKWIKKCDDDSETSNWIAANTKECPKCHVTIEKNGGCNHMICKNQACRSEFCWVCLGPWEPHGSSWYNCNRFNEDDAKKARDAQEKSRHALQRYLHYCNRYMNHHQSLKMEQKLTASIREKMEEMQQHNMSWIEVQFLRKAVEVLCLCRQTLMYTYAFAFYLKRNNHSMIFEDNQADLEIAVEKLSGYLERDITSDNAVDTKQKVQDKYRYCEQRRKVLLDHVHEGYDKDYWEYIEE